MKKEILQNNEYLYEVKYIISKNKWAVYKYDKVLRVRVVCFYKNEKYYRSCNEGPQYKDKYVYIYRENNKLHNFYDYSYIDKSNNTKLYYIYNNYYKPIQFYQYLSTYNDLNYKRTY